MKNRVPIFMAVVAMILTISFVIIPMPASAAIADGTYELNYEMKEAHSENTSIADGYFTKPAKLTVKNGVQYIQMTVTGSNYVASLSAPSGPVEVISDDTTNFVRVVKFRVDGDLSKPLNMEMHIIVPDLYDMTHTARAVFDVSGVTQEKAAAANNVNKSTNSEKTSKSEAKPVEKKEKTETQTTNTAKNESTKEEQVVEKTEEVEEPEEKTESVDAEADEEEESSEEENSEEDSTSSEETAASEVKDAQEEDSSSGALWISLIVIVVIIAGFVFWKFRRKNK
ncbi:NEAT domain-containing protein [Paucisalibacillus globulus]|uniref:NEAT domain-containing protein n=1 Tax=Paucisalibacillus globulus TaxID=351095 RepID=UPI00040BE172|nr:NEAT domain-containing protein [Paucisalibacillus globulus]